MKHNQSLITLALVAGALVGAVQTLACNPSAALTGRIYYETRKNRSDLRGSRV